MGPPPDEYTKPYWVFGLPIWRSAHLPVFPFAQVSPLRLCEDLALRGVGCRRYYRTTHIFRAEGLPQLMLERRNHDPNALESMGKKKKKKKKKGKKNKGR